MSPIREELIVILVIALAVFWLAKPLALKFSTESDFNRRRNVWILLTVVAFLSPNFWLFVLVAAPLYIWAGRKDSNPVAFYLIVLHVIPATLEVPIPAVLVNQVFDLSNYRLLALVVLIPAALRLRHAKGAPQANGLQITDVLLLGYGLLQILLFIPPDLPDHTQLQDSATNLLRRAFLFIPDMYVIYYVTSRACRSRGALLEAQAALCLSAVLMAALAVFESTRHLLLYSNLDVQWTGDARGSFYLMRGGSLRAQVSAGPSLALGYLLAIGYGFWLNLRFFTPARLTRAVVMLLLGAGLLASYSRGPWLGVVLIGLVFTLVNPRPVSRLIKVLCLTAALAGFVAMTPVGDKIASVVPILGGSVDVYNITYRERLVARSWELILQHPFLGDQLANLELTDLHQGQGIIDFVNTYASVTVFYGVVGFMLMFGFMLSALVRAYRKARREVSSDPELARLGFSIVACMVGTLLMLYTASFMASYEVLFFVLTGLAAAYSNLVALPDRASAEVQAHAPSGAVNVSG
jgi:O-antigen ligase